MRSNALLKLAAKLYPGAWRERYGAEFDSYLENLSGSWSDFMNIAWHALRPEVAHLPAITGVGVGYWALQPYLCDMTTALAAAMLTYGAGVPAIQEAGSIHLAYRQMPAVQACAGLGLLVGLSVLTTFSRVRVFERWPRLRTGLCAAALPLAVVAQAARITLSAVIML